MERRDFLRVSWAGALALGAPIVAGAAIAPRATAPIERFRIRSPLTPESLQALTRPEILELLGVTNVRAAGKQFVDMHPEEGSADDLVSALIAHLRLRPNAPAHRIQAALRTAVGADFAHGRTLRLEGWLLSLTEARQCALFAMVK